MRQKPPVPQQRFPNLGVLTTPFGGQTAMEGRHPGIDIANIKGSPVPSTTGGVVTQAVNGQPQGQGFGNFVTVRDGRGNQHRYSHLNNSYVKVGDKVQPGQRIGAMGNSGASYSQSGRGDGTHLDYRIVDAYGRYKNPIGYIKRLS